MCRSYVRQYSIVCALLLYIHVGLVPGPTYGTNSTYERGSHWDIGDVKGSGDFKKEILTGADCTTQSLSPLQGYPGKSIIYQVFELSEQI